MKPTFVKTGINYLPAIKTLSIYTAGSFNIWALSGNAKASCRAHIMADLLGLDKYPQSKSGVNAIKDEFYRQAKILGDCERNRELAFIDFCSKHSENKLN